MTEIEEKTHLSPLDDRYRSKTKELKKYFSEFALFKYRLTVELEYFVELCKLCLQELPVLRNLSQERLESTIKLIIDGFNYEDYSSIKKYEHKIKHDVKALEYFIRDKFDENLLTDYKSFIHFGLTSRDVNNTAVSLSVKNYITIDYGNDIVDVLGILTDLRHSWKDIVMISRTHGQPAVPTTLGKEIHVFIYRVIKQLKLLTSITFYGKFGGAVGTLAAHKTAYPEIEWVKFGSAFMKKLGLERSEYTTQIDNYDNLGTVFDNVKRINTILIDMCRDIWMYISMDYIKQKINKDEVGSSTMPHKVNPINFENAEGNLMLANANLEFFSRKLPISRLQRDLTDSTVLRNIGTAFGYVKLAISNIKIGLSKLDVNRNKITQDLNDNVVVITEGLQTILRKYGYIDAYEKLKGFSRISGKINKAKINEFIDFTMIVKFNQYD